MHGGRGGADGGSGGHGGGGSDNIISLTLVHSFI